MRRTGKQINRVYGHAERDYNQWIEDGDLVTKWVALGLGVLDGDGRHEHFGLLTGQVQLSGELAVVCSELGKKRFRHEIEPPSKDESSELRSQPNREQSLSRKRNIRRSGR